MPAPLPSIEIPQSAPFPVRSSSTILLVDDDPIVLRLLSDLLTHGGYAVLPCSSGAAAAAAFRANGHIALLLTDFQMPGITGIELANLLTATRPDLAVLLVSGSLPTSFRFGSCGEEVVLSSKTYRCISPS